MNDPYVRYTGESLEDMYKRHLSIARAEAFALSTAYRARLLQAGLSIAEADQRIDAVKTTGRSLYS